MYVILSVKYEKSYARIYKESCTRGCEMTFFVDKIGFLMSFKYSSLTKGLESKHRKMELENLLYYFLNPLIPHPKSHLSGTAVQITDR